MNKFLERNYVAHGAQKCADHLNKKLGISLTSRAVAAAAWRLGLNIYKKKDGTDGSRRQHRSDAAVSRSAADVRRLASRSTEL